MERIVEMTPELKVEEPRDPAVKAAIKKALETAAIRQEAERFQDRLETLGIPPTSEEWGRETTIGDALDRETHIDVIRRMENAGYPKRARRNLVSMRGPGLRKAKELLPRTLRDCMLLLIGERGPGKTQIATWLAYERRMQHGKGVGLYVKAIDLFDALKETWSAQRSEDSVLRPYKRTSFLVIDEIHERGESDWEDRKLVNLLDHRYDNMLVTVLIGNMTPEQAKQRLNPSILSRIKETGGLINCDWPSYR